MVAGWTGVARSKYWWGLISASLAPALLRGGVRVRGCSFWGGGRLWVLRRRTSYLPRSPSWLAGCDQGCGPVSLSMGLGEDAHLGG